MPEKGKLEHTALCGVLLALITLAVYLPVIELRFITLDDSLYLTENPKVQAGLTWDSVRWAFTQSHAANWHPLTWLSHMLDCQLFGLKPAGHHLTNLVFHTANTLLLFALLKRLTGALWRSAFVAALFALHPLHVESVAWAAERKDVLSTFFFLLTLGAYARYAEVQILRAKAQSQKAGVRKREAESRNLQEAPRPPHSAPFFYLLSLLLFAFGLMSKPMLVTLPLVLLLLDYWPLRRFQPATAPRPTNLWRLVVEKAPFFALSAASCVITLLAQRAGGAVSALEGASAVSLESRISNVPVSYVWYLVKLLWPSDLAVIYPFVRVWSTDRVFLASVLVVALTGLALGLGRRRGYLAVGWLWYLGTLVPVIGLVKVGTHSIADRYTYIPAIGLFIILAWGMADLTARWPKRVPVLAAGATAILAGCALVVGAQLLHWQDSESLFRHALAVTRDNYVACNNLGLHFTQQGELGLARKYFQAAAEIAPNYAGAPNNLGVMLVNQKRYAEAVEAFQAALRITPQSADAESNLGAALHYLGRTDEAIRHLREAIRLNPEHALAHYHLGSALLQQGHGTEAAGEFQLAIQLNPRNAEAHYHLAATLAGQRKPAQAIQHYREALKILPDFAEALNNLAWILAANSDPQVRNGREAVALAERACQLTESKQPIMVGTLAAAYAEAGRFAEAVATAEKAKALAEQSSQADLAAQNGALLERYRSGQPARDTP